MAKKKGVKKSVALKPAKRKKAASGAAKKTARKKAGKKVARKAQKKKSARTSTTGKKRIKKKTAPKAAKKKTVKKVSRKKPASPKKTIKKVMKKPVLKTAVAKPKRIKKIKPPFGPKTLAMLEKALTDERKSIITELERLEMVAGAMGRNEVNEELPGYSIHPAEYATDHQIRETTLGLIRMEEIKLQEVETSISRIREGTYGYCLNCGKKILLERLKAKPFATYCIPCRRAHEMGLI